MARYMRGPPIGFDSTPLARPRRASAVDWPTAGRYGPLAVGARALVAKNYYDVIVIGTQLGPLVAAALLARRGFRVLVIAHDDLPWTYGWGGARLQQEPFTVAGAETPAVKRVLSELSLTQIFRRRATPHEPAYQVVTPRHRVDFTTDEEAFGREIDREFPEVRRAAEGFYQLLDARNRELDKVLGSDLVLPPETFFERRELDRAAVHNPFAPARGPVDPFADVPAGHPFRAAILAQVRWASELDVTDGSPLPLVRLHASWARGTHCIEGGLEGLKALILDRISTHSGDVRKQMEADRIVLRRGRVAGVRMKGQEDVTGCNFVVLGTDLHRLEGLIDLAELGKKFNQRYAEVRPAYRRYTLNLVVEGRVVPEGMAHDVLLLADPAAPLEEENLLRIETTGAPSDELRTFCVGAMLPADRLAEPGFLASMRERVLERARWLVPFLDDHLVAVDSPHDGRPLRDVRRAVDVPLGDRSSRSPDRMPTVCRIDRPGPLDVTGITHRTGVKNLLVASRQVVPGLAMEGEFLAALGVARIITSSDRSKRKLRRESFTKIDV